MFGSVGVIFLLAACPEVEGIDPIGDAGTPAPEADDGGPAPEGEPDPGPENNCPTFPVAGIEVIVRDDAGARVCDATVVATDGAFEEILQVADGAGPNCFYFGVFERAGAYAVTISADGFLNAEPDDAVIVSLDPCGDARTQAVEVTLVPGDEPEPSPTPEAEPEPQPEPEPEPEPEPDPPPVNCPDGLVAAAGDVTLSTDEELTAFQEVECVEGTLRITDTAFVDGTANALVVIGRDLIVDAAPNLETLGLGNLEVVGRDVVVEDNSALVDINLDSLLTVGGNLHLGGAGKPLPAYTNVDQISSVETVGGDIRFEETAVTSLDQVFGALDDVAGFLYAINNEDLQEIRLLNQMTSLGGMVINNNPQLETIRAREVQSGFSRLETTANPALVGYDFRGLAVVAGDVVIDGCAFTDGDFRDLTDVSGDVTVNATEVDDLTTPFEALTNVAGVLSVTNNAQLPEEDAIDWANGVTTTTTLICGNENGATCN